MFYGTLVPATCIYTGPRAWMAFNFFAVTCLFTDQHDVWMLHLVFARLAGPGLLSPRLAIQGWTGKWGICRSYWTGNNLWDMQLACKLQDLQFRYFYGSSSLHGLQSFHEHCKSWALKHKHVQCKGMSHHSSHVLGTEKSKCCNPGCALLFNK